LAIRFRRTLRIAPGIRLNLSRSGISSSIGPRGASVTLSRRGTYANVGMPGTGISWRGRIDGGKGRKGTGTRQAAAVSAAPLPVNTAPVETAGKAALDAALAKAHLRRPFTDALSSATVNPDVPIPKGNVVLEGRIGRGRFLGFALILVGLLLSLVWLQDTYPRTVPQNVFLLGTLAIGAVAALVIALRSRAAGVAPWITFFGIGFAAYLGPWGLALILGALVLAPGRERAAP